MVSGGGKARSPSSLANERYYRLFVEQVTDYALFMLDPKGMIATWNIGAQRIKGYSADEIIGKHFSCFYPRSDVDAGKPDYELEAAAREGRFEDEGWRIRKDGSRFWANVVITAIRDEADALIGFAKVTRDLTDRKRAEEQRVELAKEIATREATQRALELVRRLHIMAGSLAGAATPEDVTDAIVQEGVHAISASAGLVVEPRQTDLEIVKAHSVEPHARAKEHRFSADERAIVEEALTSRTTQWTERRDRTVERVALPLAVGHRVLGAVSFLFAGPRRLEPTERALLETMAAQAAQALDRAQIHAREVHARASLLTTLRSIGDGVIATDHTGAITMMNPVAEALTGWPEEDARGRPVATVFQIINEHSREIVESPVEKVLSLGIVVGLANHTLLITRDGREVPIDDSGAPIRSGDQIQGVVLVFRDVTEKKRVESRRNFLADATALLAESIDYTLRLGELANLAVPRFADWCAIDVMHREDAVPKRIAVAHVDPTKIALAEELHDRHLPQADAAAGVGYVIRSGRSELVTEISDEALASASVDEEQLRLLRELGLRSRMIVPLVSTGGRTLGAMTFAYGASARTYTPDDLELAEELGRRCATAIENAALYASVQRAREASDAANRAKDEFLAIVSHELRTPLNAILGWAKMLGSPQIDEARRDRAIDIIERNAVAMAQLIEDILDMSRVVSGKMRLEVHPVDLRRVVEATMESIKPTADTKGVRLTSSLARELPPLMGDPTRLQQIAWNLLSNAIKFTPREGEVKVRLHGTASAIELEVSDTGKGIDPSFLPHVFDAFRQQDASYARTRGGLGLGLAITRQLVELHGGRIVAESEGEGRGATFRVALPIANGSVTSESARRSSKPQRRDRHFECPRELHGLRILVVDDEPDASELIAAILADCECHVRIAASVDEAIDAFEREIPDVLVSDIGMPGKDGYELIRHVRALPPEKGGDVPAAALTAYTHVEDRRRILNAGFSMHVAKPIEPAELVAVLTSLTRFMPRHRSS
jgi:PAS domain S-box-containing protein